MESTNKDLLRILSELEHIKNHMPNGELKRIEKSIDKLNNDVSEIKKTLLDPFEGVIVQNNRNSDLLDEFKKKVEQYDKEIHELDKLREWKSAVTKALWIGFTAIVSIFIKIIFYSV